ncbi:serine palmitoyltransferase component [Castilleja foliolosa]|uniref:Serine palmitoyltransferase component n=1 Tax=Castilleja foliolosa TaxID=1961234 RepID=A0ABD3EK72_9LAMI
MKRLIGIAFGQLRDFFRKIFDWWSRSNLQGYAPICLWLEDFYIRRLYLRIQDCFNRPISSPPDSWFDLVERVSNDNNKTLKMVAPLVTPPPVTPCTNRRTRIESVSEVP